MSGSETANASATDEHTLALEFPAPEPPSDYVPDPDETTPTAPRPGSNGEHVLQSVYGDQQRADRFYRDQVLDHLNPAMAEFVDRMELAFIATADASGEADCSMRAGDAGFIRVLDPGHVAYPEYRGNGVHASLGNISENPHVGMMLPDFARDQIGLHINGRARIVEHAEMTHEYPALAEGHEPGRRPQRWVVLAVQEAYVHCRKHVPRMQPVDRDRAERPGGKGGDYFGVRAARATTTQPGVDREGGPPNG